VANIASTTNGGIRRWIELNEEGGYFGLAHHRFERRIQQPQPVKTGLLTGDSMRRLCEAGLGEGE
jgi:hypothetical protein